MYVGASAEDDEAEVGLREGAVVFEEVISDAVASCEMDELTVIADIVVGKAGTKELPPVAELDEQTPDWGMH